VDAAELNRMVRSENRAISGIDYRNNQFVHRYNYVDQPPLSPVAFFKYLREQGVTMDFVDYQEYELSASEFDQWRQQRGIPLSNILGAKAYAYSGGGILPNIVGTALLTVGAVLIALILGMLVAIYLSEYSSPGRTLNTIRLSVLNLAGVPSVVFGIFGFGAFVLFLGWNTSLLAGCFTLAFMVLPVIIASCEESMKSVPQGFREGALALGASKWKAIRTNVIPYALPGIMTSSILGITRVAGETAPIMFTAAYASTNGMPWDKGFWQMFMEPVMALPYHIYVVSLKIPQNAYTEKMQYGTSFVFVLLVGAVAATSVYMRARARKKYHW
jgi:phosphate transport system permease protein